MRVRGGGGVDAGLRRWRSGHRCIAVVMGSQVDLIRWCLDPKTQLLLGCSLGIAAERGFANRS